MSGCIKGDNMSIKGVRKQQKINPDNVLMNKYKYKTWDDRITKCGQTGGKWSEVGCQMRCV